MKINKLLRKARLKKVLINHEVGHLTDDSRDCCDGAVYVAVCGERSNGANFIHEAILNGARTVVTAQRCIEEKNINYVYVEDARKALSELARVYYKNVSSKLKLIGVIGTNGKTTTSTIAYEFFEFLHKPSMLIGSNGIFFKGYEARIDNTTPHILTIYRYLALAKKKRIKYVFMEVSSISVDQLRVNGLEFYTLIFTNFSEDHLDYHHSMDKYFGCKLIPFAQLKRTKYAILNSDDPSSKTIRKFCQSNIVDYGYKNDARYQANKPCVSKDGIQFFFKNIYFKSSLLGEFNLYNTLTVLPLCDILHIPYLYYASFLGQYKEVAGRMNLITFKGKSIIIDYAHTEVAVENAVKEVISLKPKKLFIVVGCGGNREKEKRIAIGKFLDSVDAQVILTTDNPRFEDPKDIVQDIETYMEGPHEVILNRKDAILTVLEELKEGDYALILGKGCENYMDIKGVKYPYSDMEVIHGWIRSH